MLTADDLLDAVETAVSLSEETLRRGRAYAAEGRVRRLRCEASAAVIVVTAVVDGTRSYTTTVTGTPARTHLRLSGRCTCALQRDCKHVVAAVVALQARASSSPWRSVLDHVLDDAEGEAATAAAGQDVVRVGVQLVLPRRPPTTRRGWSPVPGPGRTALPVRAVRLGSSGRWVKGGMGWGELAGGPYARPSAVRLDPGDDQLLAELGLALAHQRSYLVHSNDALDLGTSGPRVWSALGRLVERGAELLCSDPSVTVRLAGGGAVPEIDLGRTGDSLQVVPGVRVEGEWFAGAQVGLVGEPVHGVALWRGPAGRPGSSLLLAPLRAPLTAALRRWLESAPLVVDAAGAQELEQEYLPRLSRSVAVGSRDGTVTLPEAPTIRLHGDVTWHDDGTVELAWRWTYRQGATVRQYPCSDRGRAGVRDRAAETALLEGLAWSPELADLLSVDAQGRGTLADQVVLRDREAMRFGLEHLPWLAAQPTVELAGNDDPPQFRPVDGAPQVRFVARGAAERRDRTDWLDLEVVVSVTDAELGPIALDLPRVLAALVSGDTRIMVHRGVYVDVDRPELDRLARLVQDARQLSDQPPTGLRLSSDAHDLLAEIADFGPGVGQVAEWSAASRALRDLVADGRARVPAPVPAGLRATLRPYQHEGFQWLHLLQRHGLGGVLADDMGLGKTVQTLAMIAASRPRTGGPDAAPRPFLVVAPSSVVTTWVSEAARFTPELQVVPVTGSTARRGWRLDPEHPAAHADVVVTTYTLLRLEAEQYASIRWAGLVLDEAQAVKNHRSKTHAALRRLDADCRFAITGTPIENNLMELWSILALVAPGLYPHVEQFRNDVALPVQQQADPEVLARLRHRLRPVLLRRTRDLVAPELPELSEQVVSVQLSPRHRRIYDVQLQRERQRVLKLLDDLEDHRITVLASLTRLRQLSLDPALVDPDHEQVGSAKLDELVARLTEVVGEGHRALVFSQFTSYLARVRRRLDSEGIDHAYLDGSTRDRTAVIDAFRSGDAPVFVISLKAGGVGLTLTEADYCFLLDPWWNPAVEAQAIGRTHRIGQRRPVLAYRLVSADTIEEKVVELAARKADLYASVLDDDGMLSQQLSADDIAALLG